MPDGFPDELSEFDKQWLTLVGTRAGETVSAALQLFAEPEDDEAFYRRAATALLELRAEALVHLLGGEGVRETFERLAWEVIEKKLPTIMASKD